MERKARGGRFKTRRIAVPHKRKKKKKKKKEKGARSRSALKPAKNSEGRTPHDGRGA